MFVEEEWLPISSEQLKPIEIKLRQDPLGVRLPLELPATTSRVIVVRDKPDHTPLVLGLGLLALFGLLAFLAARK